MARRFAEAQNQRLRAFVQRIVDNAKRGDFESGAAGAVAGRNGEGAAARAGGVLCNGGGSAGDFPRYLEAAGDFRAGHIEAEAELRASFFLQRGGAGAQRKLAARIDIADGEASGLALGCGSQFDGRGACAQRRGEARQTQRHRFVGDRIVCAVFVEAVVENLDAELLTRLARRNADAAGGAAIRRHRYGGGGVSAVVFGQRNICAVSPGVGCCAGRRILLHHLRGEGDQNIALAGRRSAARGESQAQCHRRAFAHRCLRRIRQANIYFEGVVAGDGSRAGVCASRRAERYRAAAAANDGRCAEGNGDGLVRFVHRVGEQGDFNVSGHLSRGNDHLQRRRGGVIRTGNGGAAADAEGNGDLSGAARRKGDGNAQTSRRIGGGLCGAAIAHAVGGGIAGCNGGAGRAEGDCAAGESVGIGYFAQRQGDGLFAFVQPVAQNGNADGL